MPNHYHLNLGRQGLKAIPEEVFDLRELTELRIHSNEITEISPKISLLKDLEILNLKHNRLTFIPDEVFQLPNLKILMLGENQIKELPKSIKLAHNLQWLFAENNQLTDLPQELSELSFLNKLQLHKNRFNRIPEVLFNIPFLEELEISLNKSRYELPENLLNWKRLEKLKITDGGLKKLSEGFVSLTRLETLNLCRNKLEHFPPEILSIRGLKKLYLNSNRINEMPSDIVKLRYLTHLNVGDNQLRALPHNIYDLPNLKELTVSRNLLTDLPPIMNKGRSIETLRASKNQIKTLPEEYLQAPNLKHLILNHNPLEINESLQESFSKVNWQVPLMKDAYVKDQYKGKEAVNHVKIILVGDKQSGRSSWIKKVLKEEVDLSEKLDIVFTKFTHQRNNQVFEALVSIWEPGHLELTHPTHHLIADPHAIYTIFVDATKDKEEKESLVHFWTGQLTKIGVVNPVMIVHSKLDQKRTEMPVLAGNLPFDLIHHEISFLEDYVDTVHELNLKLEEQVWKRFQLNREVSKAHQMVKDYLHELKPSKRYLSEQEFEEICEKFWIEAHDIPELSKFLHETGALLSFRNEENGKPHIFSDVHWLMEALHQLFEHPKVRASGIFDNRDLSVIWKDPQIVSHRKEILDLMTSKPFQFCFSAGTDTYIVPHLLPSIQDDEKWKQIPKYGYTWRYEYDDLPSDILFQLIGYDYIQKQNTSYWKEGILLLSQGDGVWIQKKQDSETQVIEISVQGDRDKRRTHKESLRKVFIALHQKLGLSQQVREFTECPVCKEQGRSSYLDVVTVNRRQEAGKLHATCNQCFQDIKIDHLLYGRILKTLSVIKDFIRANKVKEALFELEFYVKTHQLIHFEHELIVHISNYPDHPKNEQEVQIRARIKQAILDIIKEIEEENE